MQLHVPIHVESLEDINTNVFVTLFEGLYGEPLPGKFQLFFLFLFFLTCLLCLKLMLIAFIVLELWWYTTIDIHMNYGNSCLDFSF